MVLRKEYMEKEIMALIKSSEKVGLTITEIAVEDPRIITELEKRSIGPFHLKRKPIFVSPKNYRRVRLKEGEYGYIYGIRIIKKEG